MLEYTVHGKRKKRLFFSACGNYTNVKWVFSTFDRTTTVLGGLLGMAAYNNTEQWYSFFSFIISKIVGF